VSSSVRDFHSLLACLLLLSYMTDRDGDARILIIDFFLGETSRGFRERRREVGLYHSSLMAFRGP
jgi:hypothetical protein